MENQNKKERKTAFILILLFFVIFVILSGASTYFKILGKDIPPEPINILKELYFDGKIWFYDKTDNLLGKYVCVNKDGICELITNTNYDDNYKINNYNKSNDSTIELINDTYAFIRDVESEAVGDVLLYNVQTDYVYPVLDKSQAIRFVKNYGIGIDGDYYIIQRGDNQYGLLELKKDKAPTYKINFGYDYLAFKNKVTDNNKIDSSVIIGNKSGQWFLMNLEEEHLSINLSDSITDFNDDSIITVDALGQYHYINYEGEKIISDNGYTNMYYVGDFLVLINSEELVIKNRTTFERLGNPIMIEEEKKYVVEQNESGQIIVLIDGTVSETLDF